MVESGFCNLLVPNKLVFQIQINYITFIYKRVFYLFFYKYLFLVYSITLFTYSVHSYLLKSLLFILTFIIEFYVNYNNIN